MSREVRVRTCIFPLRASAASDRVRSLCGLARWMGWKCGSGNSTPKTHSGKNCEAKSRTGLWPEVGRTARQKTGAADQLIAEAARLREVVRNLKIDDKP